MIKEVRIAERSMLLERSKGAYIYRGFSTDYKQYRCGNLPGLQPKMDLTAGLIKAFSTFSCYGESYSSLRIEQTKKKV